MGSTQHKARRSMVRTRQAKAFRRQVTPLPYFQKRHKSFSPFHMTQNQLFSRGEIAVNDNTNELISEFLLELYNPLTDSPEQYNAEVHPDETTYLRLIPDEDLQQPDELSTPTGAKRKKRTKAKLLPTEIVELLEAYVHSQDFQKNSSQESKWQAKLHEFENFTESIQKIHNLYLMQTLQADPQYQNIAILSAFIDVFSQQIALLINLLMSYSLEKTPFAVDIIVKNMYALIDRLDINFAGSQYETKQKHPKDPYKSRKKLDVPKFVRHTYLTQWEKRKRWLPSVDENGDPILDLYESYSDQYPELNKAIKSLKGENLLFSDKDRENIRKEYLAFLYDNFLDKETKDRADDFHSIYNSVTASEENRRAKEQTEAIQTLRIVFNQLTFSNIFLPIFDNYEQMHRFKVDLLVTVFDAAAEYPRFNELFKIAAEDIKDHAIPVMNAFTKLCNIVKAHSSESERATALNEFVNAIQNHRFKKFPHFDEITQCCHQLKKLIIDDQTNDISLLNKIFAEITTSYFNMIYMYSNSAEYKVRSLFNLGYQDISTISALHSNISIDPNQHQKNQQSKMSEKNFLFRIKDAIMHEILQYTQ